MSIQREELSQDIDLLIQSAKLVLQLLYLLIQGEYDMGWSRNADGSFDLIADLWGVAKKHNQAELINSINQKYAVNKTLAEIKQPGLQNANVKLLLQN